MVKLKILNNKIKIDLKIKMEKKNQKLSKLETIHWKLRNFIIFKVIRIFYSRFMMTLAIWFFLLTYLFSFNNKLPHQKIELKSF